MAGKSKSEDATQGSLQDLMKKVDVMIEATGEEVASGTRRCMRRRASGDIRGRRGARADRLLLNATATTTARRVGVLQGGELHTTGLCRTLHALKNQLWGEKRPGVLARRAADPQETGKGPIDAVVPDLSRSRRTTDPR